MKKSLIKKKKKSQTFIINTAVKIFLFPLFIFGILLREYDRIFKKRKLRKEQKDYGIKDVEETLYKILNL